MDVTHLRQDFDEIRSQNVLNGLCFALISLLTFIHSVTTIGLCGKTGKSFLHNMRIVLTAPTAASQLLRLHSLLPPKYFSVETNLSQRLLPSSYIMSRQGLL